MQQSGQGRKTKVAAKGFASAWRPAPGCARIFGSLLCPPWPRALLEKNPQHQTRGMCILWARLSFALSCQTQSTMSLGVAAAFCSCFAFFFFFGWILVKQAKRARSCVISESRSPCLHRAVVSKAVPGWAHQALPSRCARRSRQGKWAQVGCSVRWKIIRRALVLGWNKWIVQL